MKLLKNILVAVDFDDTGGPLLAGARTLAKQFDSNVVLLHTIESDERTGQPVEKLEAAITARLEEWRGQLLAAGVAVPQILCRQGKAFVEIVTAADRVDANLIMVGSRGVATDHHFPLGTTTEKVIRRSQKPVLAVQPDKPLGFSNILCPVDFSDASARGLTNAIRLARAFGGKLHVLTVLSPPSRYHRLDQYWAQWAASAEAMATKECLREFDEFLTRFDFRDVAWEKHITTGDPARQIVQSAKSTNADLIVMGSVGRTGLPYVLMGSTAVKVARQLPCALLTVKREQVLVADVEQKIADINAAFEEGRELLAQGFCQEAIARFEQCLCIDPHFAHAIEAKAEAFERLGRTEQAEQCRKLAEMIKRELWEQQVTASVRAHHPFFHRRGPYDS
jgi:nucleotide-binding universal stress UspA family protein